MLFDLTVPNNKNPMSFEIDTVIKLLKIIQENIVLLDPLDLEPQKSMTISGFKKQIVENLKSIVSSTAVEDLKFVLNGDIGEELVDILQKQFIDNLISMKSYNERQQLR